MKNESVSEILSRRINAMGLGRQYKAAHICAVADAIGDGEFKAVSYKNGSLKIHVSSGARAHLIKLREAKIIAKINKELKNDLIKKLVFDIE